MLQRLPALCCVLCALEHKYLSVFIYNKESFKTTDHFLCSFPLFARTRHCVLLFWGAGELRESLGCVWRKRGCRGGQVSSGLAI